MAGFVVSLVVEYCGLCLVRDLRPCFLVQVGVSLPDAPELLDHLFYCGRSAPDSGRQIVLPAPQSVLVHGFFRGVTRDCGRRSTVSGNSIPNVEKMRVGIDMIGKQVASAPSLRKGTFCARLYDMHAFSVML